MDNDKVLTLVTPPTEDETGISSDVVSNDTLGRKWKGLMWQTLGPESSLLLLLAFTTPNPLGVPEQRAGYSYLFNEETKRGSRDELKERRNLFSREINKFYQQSD